MRLISVVLPVYNESGSIGPCLRGLWAALASEDHEILVCYDTEEDTTLPAIAAMPDRPPSVRLVRNTLGRGALNAIKTGFAAARGDVVVTSMADLSDPPAVILRMAEAIRGGADVVSGSRYMRGGSQRGGPWLKRTLSRIAGVSLRWIAGFGTHDATSNFRGYSRAFLDSIQIESRGGFEIALELTVKAHLGGGVVGQVPSSWVDRSSGKSNFRMWKWMPNYLRWYLRALAAPAAVWGAFVLATVLSVIFVATHASSLPLFDDLEMAPWVAPGKQPTLVWLWSQHNEHRIPLPRLVFVGLMRLTGDFRSGMYFQVLVLAALSFACILVARRVRGRMRAADVVFPFLLQHTGNAFNLLMGFQLALVLPVAIACAFLLMVVAGPARPALRTSLAMGLCVLALPLNGGAGISQAPALAAWMALAGFASARSSDRGERRAGWTILAAAAGVLLLVGAYAIGFRYPPNHAHSSTIGPAVRVADEVAALAFGPAGMAAWPFSGVAIALLVLATAVLLAITTWTNPAQRWRASGLLASLAATACLAASIGWGRGGDPGIGGFATRYVTLTAPLIATAYFAWLLYGPFRLGRWIRGSLALLLAASFLFNAQEGAEFGRKRRAMAARVEEDVRAGKSIPEIAARNWRSLYPSKDGCIMRLEALHKAGLPPFRGRAYEANAPPPDRAFESFKTAPDKVVTSRELLSRKVGATRVMLAFPPSELWFEVPPGAKKLTGQFGIHPDAVRRDRTKGVRFTVEWVGGEDPATPATAAPPPVVLYDRLLDPTRVFADRGFQELSVDLPRDRSGSIVLRTSNPPEDRGEWDWAFWTEIAID